MKEIDNAFIKRTYISSAYLWIFGVLVWLSLWHILTGYGIRLNPHWGWMAAIGWSLGSAVSIGTLWSLEWIVSRAFVPGNRHAKKSLVKFSILKLIVIILLMGLIVKLGGKSFALIGAFCAGVVLTQAVIFLKVIGKLICEHSNDLGKGGPQCTRDHH
ncbi:hypothetical protein LLG46_04985 [bacterium]|nr:hypothetical protein [bacterium]